jgi:hypothetical protein
MPRGDGTGPTGMGPFTGRGMGYCAGYGMPGYANSAFGRGFGAGFGRGRGFFGGGGRGWRNRFYATGLPGWARYGGYGYAGFPPPAVKPDPEMEKQALKAQADALEAELEMLRQRLAAVESGMSEE